MKDKFVSVTSDNIGKIDAEELSILLISILRQGVDSRDKVEKCGIYCVILKHIFDNTSRAEHEMMKFAMDEAEKLFGVKK